MTTKVSSNVMVQARQLIENKQYVEAYKLLTGVNTPQAEKWKTQLKQRIPSADLPKESKTKNSIRPAYVLIAFVVILTLSVAQHFGGYQQRVDQQKQADAQIIEQIAKITNTRLVMYEDQCKLVPGQDTVDGKEAVSSCKLYNEIFRVCAAKATTWPDFNNCKGQRNFSMCSVVFPVNTIDDVSKQQECRDTVQANAKAHLADPDLGN